MSDPNLDKQLRDFLDNDAAERRRGLTIEHVITQVQEVVRSGNETRLYVERLNASQLAMNMRLDRHGRRLRRIEEVVLRGDEVASRAAEDTGSHQLEDLQKAMALQHSQWAEAERSKRESGIWWKRKRWEVTFAIALAVFVAALGACSTLAMSRALSSEGVKR